MKSQIVLSTFARHEELSLLIAASVFSDSDQRRAAELDAADWRDRRGSMSKIHRIVIPVDSHDPTAWNLAVTYADKICEVGGDKVGNVVLLIHTKAQLKHTDLARFVGDAQSKRLDKGEALNMSSGAMLRCEALRTVGTMLPPTTVVIAYWADMEMMDKIDGLRNVAGVVAVPEFPDNVKDWETRWGPIIHGKERAAETPLIPDPIIERAMRSLDVMVNRSTGIGHPRDKQSANEVFRILRNKGHHLDPNAIKSWAIKAGWAPRGATDLAALASKIAGLKAKPSLSAIYGAEDRYARWEAES